MPKRTTRRPSAILKSPAAAAVRRHARKLTASEQGLPKAPTQRGPRSPVSPPPEVGRAPPKCQTIYDANSAGAATPWRGSYPASRCPFNPIRIYCTSCCCGHPATDRAASCSGSRSDRPMAPPDRRPVEGGQASHSPPSRHPRPICRTASSIARVLIDHLYESPKSMVWAVGLGAAP
jgi:hypothetical protein